jgi:Dolichyl-phosphate-mannose-protein mannosyltransferase
VGLAILPASACVVLAGFVIAAWLPLRGATERLAAALLLSIGCVTSVLLLTGVVLGSLQPLLVLGLSVVLLVAAILGTGLRQPATRAAAWARLGTEIRRALRVLARDRLVLILGVAVVLALAWRAVLAVRLPVLDYDGVSYHLVTADVWIQTDHIGRVPQRPWSDGFPSDGEVLSLWLMLFDHNDGLASLTGLLPIPLAAVATAGLARTLGASRRWAALAGLVVVAVPAVMFKANSTYVDNSVMAAVASAWFFGLRAMGAETDRRRRIALAFLAGVAIGLGVGTKATLVIPLGFLSLAVLVAAFRVPPRRPWRDSVVELAALALPAFALGASWYLKNLVVFGNPMWPFTYGPFTGIGTFEELIVQTPDRLAGMSRWAQIAISWVADIGRWTYPTDLRIGGFGLGWLPLLALAGLGVVVLLRSRRFVLVGLLGLPALITLAIMPMPWWPRYTLFLAVLAAAFAAVALTRLPSRAGVVAGGMVAVLALVSLGVTHRNGNVSVNPDRTATSSLRTVAKVLLAGDARRRDMWLWHDCRGFEERIPIGSRVLTDGFNLLHLIIGPNIDRQVVRVIDRGADPGPVVSGGGDGITHLALIDPGSIAAAQRESAEFEDLGEACLGVDVFEVRAP